MTNRTPAITLLIPCFNAARFLPRLMENVRAMTVPFESILAYDDGSTDDTVTVARTLGLEIITPNPNGGVARARNRLASAASSEWIHFHDADDLLAPGFVERLAADCNDRHDVICCDADWLIESTRAVQIPWRYDSTALARNAFRYLLQHPLSLNNSIIRRESWLKVGGCDESLPIWEDADLHIRLARAGARFHHVPEVLTTALRHDDSFSHDYRRSWRCRLSALERYALTPEIAQIRDIVALEAERAAGQLAWAGDRQGAVQAIALCRRLGGHPPTSRHPLIRAMKPFVPVHTLLCWQTKWRQRARESRG